MAIVRPGGTGTARFLGPGVSREAGVEQDPTGSQRDASARQALDEWAGQTSAGGGLCESSDQARRPGTAVAPEGPDSGESPAGRPKVMGWLRHGRLGAPSRTGHVSSRPAQKIVEIDAAARSSMRVGSTPRYRMTSTDSARAAMAVRDGRGTISAPSRSVMYIITTTRR